MFFSHKGGGLVGLRLEGVGAYFFSSSSFVKVYHDEKAFIGLANMSTISIGGRLILWA